MTGLRRCLVEVGRASIDRGTPMTTRNERRAPIRLRSRLRSTSAWRAGQAVTRPTKFIRRAPIRVRSRLRSTSGWRAGQAVTRATCSGQSADSRWRFGLSAPIHRNRFGFISIELQNPAHLSTFLERFKETCSRSKQPVGAINISPGHEPRGSGVSKPISRGRSDRIG